jgi:hypothetical protein
MSIYLKILAFTALVIGFAAFGSPERACATQTPPPAGGGAAAAGTIAPQTCDTEVWKTMVARGRIETEREIMQNQNLIFKPDSVLAYTCFDSMAAHAAANAGVLFTHTSYWNPKPIEWGQDGKYRSLDVAVNKTVIDAMKTYYSSNYNHTMLGGRGSDVGLADMHQANVQASSSSAYTCNVMGRVWGVAKCLNFIHTTAWAQNDGFYPFITIQPGPGGGSAIASYQDKTDVRKYPTACSGTPLTGSTWELQYRESRNETDFGSVDRLYQFGTPLNTAFTEVRTRVAPGACAAAIPTGVTVILGPGTTSTHPDGVCTNPGCTYQKSGQCLSSPSTLPAGPNNASGT